MSASQHDLGELDEIDVEAIGEPGHRTFRLLLEQGATTASLWMEKEQLEQLAVVIEQQLAQVNPTRPLGSQPTLTLAARFPALPTIDFKVGRLAVGFDPDTRRFVLSAHPIGGSDEEVSCVATQAQAEALSSKIVTVAAAGRPRCPLCGAPIEGKHVCPVSNGHVHA